MLLNQHANTFNLATSNCTHQSGVSGDTIFDIQIKIWISFQKNSNGFWLADSSSPNEWSQSVDVDHSCISSLCEQNLDRLRRTQSATPRERSSADGVASCQTCASINKFLRCISASSFSCESQRTFSSSVLRIHIGLRFDKNRNDFATIFAGCPVQGGSASIGIDLIDIHSSNSK